MKLKDLTYGLDALELYLKDLDVTNINNNSSLIEEGGLFIAIKGLKTDGHSYIDNAIENGASCFVVESKEVFNKLKEQGYAVILVNNSREALSYLSDRFYGSPSKKLKVIGITGTKGKTTTAFYIKRILEQCGAKVGLIGTIANYIGEKEIPTKLTTPESLEINKLMNDMVQSGCDYCVMEVSSHALELKRVNNIDFDFAVFTNITSDHMDYHLTFENYLNAKKILFDNLKSEATAIINIDDPNSKRLIENCAARKVYYGLSDNADYSLSDVKSNFEGTSYNIKNGTENYKVTTTQIGNFNAYNSSIAFIIADIIGYEKDTILKALKEFKQVPGRFEVVKSGNRIVIVDYSHTADSLEKTLLNIKSISGNKNIVTVFGCGGDRDKTKRPIMGAIAEKYSDKVYVTSDNPRTEDPLLIIEDIIKGMNENNYEVEADRKKAIIKSIQDNEDSVILIAGKGHENYQEINGVRNYFSDIEIAKEFLGIE